MGKQGFLKIAMVWALYVLLHFTYKFFPNPVFALLGCPEETIFHHMKMGFLSYSIVSVGEFFLRRKELPGIPFVVSRALGALMLSFFCFVIWYLWPLFFGPLETELAEIIYSNVIIAVSLFTVVSLETDIGSVRFRRSTVIGIVAAWLIALCFYSVLVFTEAPIAVFELHLH